MLHHVCDLGDSPALRVLSSSHRSLVVETMARRQERILEINTERGHVRPSRSKLPIINRSTGSWSDGHWATAKNSKQDREKWRTEVQWQFSQDGPIYRVLLQGEQCIGTLCPRDSSVIFVGTRKNAHEGDGRVYCFAEGEQVWSYHPEKIAEYHDWQNFGHTKLIRAYPYRMITPSTGEFLAFSFLSFLYLLDRRGTPISQWSMGTLLYDLFGEEFVTRSPPTVVESTRRIENTPFEVTTKTGRRRSMPTYEPPVVGALRASSSGGVFVAGSKNALVWITSEGKIAHTIQVPIGARDGIESRGAICRIEMSCSGRVIVAEVGDAGLATGRDGKAFSEHALSFREPYVWAFDEQSELIAVKVHKSPCLKIFDIEWNELGLFRIDFDVKAIQFTDDGQFLLVSGGQNPVLKIR